MPMCGVQRDDVLRTGDGQMSEARFWYPASISKITSVNDSFDSCMLRVCYAGQNRNKTIISKDAIERAIPTMAYCPLVANYDVSSNQIGGHDVDFVQNDEGELKMVNLTDAIGVVPENPQWYWESVTEQDGTVRDYLSTPAILWKRTPVYEKLERDGVSGQSMEINILEGKMVDGLFQIDAFEFTAFCLLGEGVEPCFESAQVGLFSMDTLSSRLGEMMQEFRKTFSTVMTASADDINTPNGESILKGGKSSLNIQELMQKYELVAEDIDFETDGMSADELEKRFAALKAAKFAEEETEGEGQEEQAEEQGETQDETQGDSQEGSQESGDNEGGEEETPSESEPEQEDDSDEEALAKKKSYSLTGEQMWNEIMDALHTVMYTDEWGQWPRYCYTDYDPAAMEIYAYDNEDWNLYGFKYTMNGDKVVIDFESKTRKKLAYVDFEGGDAQFSYKHILDSANARFAAVAGEVAGLREYKRSVESAEKEAKVKEIFAKFTDLAEDERFKQLRENHADMEIQDIEDKCYAIRGRNTTVKFSMNNTPVRIPVERGAGFDSDEPYGGIFVEYGVGNRD